MTVETVVISLKLLHYHCFNPPFLFYKLGAATVNLGEHCQIHLASPAVRWHKHWQNLETNKLILSFENYSMNTGRYIMTCGLWSCYFKVMNWGMVSLRSKWMCLSQKCEMRPPRASTCFWYIGNFHTALGFNPHKVRVHSIGRYPE